MVTLHPPEEVSDDELKDLKDKFQGSRVQFTGTWKKVRATDSDTGRPFYPQTIYANPLNGDFYTSWSGQGAADIADYGSEKPYNIVNIWMKAWQAIKGDMKCEDCKLYRMLFPIDPNEFEEDVMMPKVFSRLATYSQPIRGGERGKWKGFEEKAVSSNSIRNIYLWSMVTLVPQMYPSEIGKDKALPKDARVQAGKIEEGDYKGDATLTAIEFLFQDIELMSDL